MAAQIALGSEANVLATASTGHGFDTAVTTGTQAMFDYRNAELNVKATQATAGQRIDLGLSVGSLVKTGVH